MNTALVDTDMALAETGTGWADSMKFHLFQCC